MADNIIADLERARSQIEGKFSKAGSVLEAALTMIGRQLELLAQLNTALNADVVDGATQDLVSTSTDLHALPASLAARGQHLRELERCGKEVQTHIEEMRGLVRYLLVFALNVKITAADSSDDAAQFEIFAQEMKTRLDHGEVELNDFENRLAELNAQIREALDLEGGLSSEAAAMLPGVPNRLSDSASAIAHHHKRVAQMAAEVSALAQKIQLKVVNALSALQIGDISRQRIEHVQSGLATLSSVDSRLAEQEWTNENRQQIRRFIYRLLATQLADTAESFDREAGSMIEHMSGMAQDTKDLLRLQQLDTSADIGGHSLRSLEKSVAEAVALVSGMDQAVENADQLRKSTATAVDELVGRVSGIKSVKEDVQFMALNTTVRCARMGEAGKPLQVIAIELRLYANKLESAANDTLRNLQALAHVAAEHEERPGRSFSAKSKLEAAVTRIRAAADVAENNLDEATRQGREVIDALSMATEQLNFKSEVGDVLTEAVAMLEEHAGDEVVDTEKIAAPLKDILDQIARTYTMAREREVHAKFRLQDIASEIAA